MVQNKRVCKEASRLRQTLQLSVPGGTTHIIPLARLHALQSLVGALGAQTYPLFLRTGATQAVQMQPVTARSLLAEVEKFIPLLAHSRLPALAFFNRDGEEIGSLYGSPEQMVVARDERTTVAIAPQGIRVVVRRFPPPVGFRSAPGLPSGEYECYFQVLQHGPEGTTGLRTPAMGGTGTPVPLELPPMPPPARWDTARVATPETVSATEFAERPAEEVFRDLWHALTSACTESLRLKRPLQIVRDAG